jgi:hypothetical protein
MAAAAAAARSMPISDVLRLRVHVLNAGGGGAVRSGGRQQGAVVQLLTTMSPESDIYHLKVSLYNRLRRHARASNQSPFFFFSFFFFLCAVPGWSALVGCDFRWLGCLVGWLGFSFNCLGVFLVTRDGEEPRFIA